MRNFENLLDEQLRQAGAREADRPWTQKAGRALTSNPRVAGLSTAATALVVVAGSVAIMSGGPTVSSAEALPIMARPSVDLRNERAFGRIAAQGGDLKDVRAIKTDDGNAYLIPGSKRWCLTIPDRKMPNPETEGGTVCVTSESVSTYGLAGLVTSDDSSTFVAIVPRDAPDPIAEYPDGRKVPLTPKSGVVAESYREPVTIKVTSTNGTELFFPAGGA